MLIPRSAVGMCAVALVILGADVACGQVYPNKPIRMVTVEAGGSGDFVARLIAQGVTGPIGQQVIVDNRGIIAAEIVAKAPPDGYTLLVYGSNAWISPLLRNNPAWNPVTDFLPVTLAASSPGVLVCASFGAGKFRQGVDRVGESEIGELNYASGGIGGSLHLAAELFKALAGVNIVHVPYKGAGPALNALIGGEVQLMFGTGASLTPHIKSGRLKALAVTSAKPSALAPGLPTVAASGLTGYESISPYGIFAPAKTPRAIISRLNQEIVSVLNRADSKEKFFNAGVEVVGSSPEQFATYIKSDMARLGKVIKDAGIRAD